MQVCKLVSKQASKQAGTHTGMIARTQECKYAGMQVHLYVATHRYS